MEENNPKRKINIHVNQNMPLCSLDKGMLEQVLYNLLNNAAIHSSPESDIDISAASHADILEFIIEDNGGGFKDINPKDIFSKFSREKTAAGDSSGLGLSIVKGFTEALGGNVELTKGNAGGAKFMLAFPVKTTPF